MAGNLEFEKNTQIDVPEVANLPNKGTEIFDTIPKEVSKPIEAPLAPEKRELLGKFRAGLQAALLLDGLKPGPGITLSREELQKVKTKIDAGQSPEPQKINNGSKHERDEFWNGEKSEFKGLKFEEQKEKWIKSTNEFLKYYESENRKGQKEILGRLNMRASEEDKIYNEYFGTGQGQGKGDLGYFAMRVADKLTPEEIETYKDLLLTIGKFYGKDSSKVARYLAEGVKNMEDETFDEFAKEAVDQFNKGLSTTEVDLINGVHERNEAWKKKQEQKEAEDEKRQKEATAAQEKKEQPEQIVEPEVEKVPAEAIKTALEHLKGSNNKLTKNFLPILESLINKPVSMSDEDYLNLVLHGIAIYEKVAKMGTGAKTKKEQLIELLGFFDNFYYGYKLGSRPEIQKYCEERIVKIEDILKGEDVNKVLKETKGEKFDPLVMNKLDEVMVEEEWVGKVVEEITPRFMMEGEVLRDPQVLVGKHKENRPEQDRMFG